MKIKLLGIALFGLTVGAIVYYPQLMAKTIEIEPSPSHHTVAIEKPKVDVVFVLDTTGSMGGLIQTAKEKIWSIATTMASAQQAPEIRIGLVAYRDRGDAYVTRVVDLSPDLDSVYATLMDFQARGGGDTPESVNKALYDAVHNMSWSQEDQAYQAIFLTATHGLQRSALPGDCRVGQRERHRHQHDPVWRDPDDRRTLDADCKVESR
jgi:Mg-chelatase subunit ChlD